MHTQLREAAAELGPLLWREHTLYRERGGGVVIRGEHVGRWISLAPRGTRDDILVRAGRILDGGTTAPARSEAVVSLAVGRDELAALCRRLLADAADGPGTTVFVPGPRTAAHRGRTGGRPRTAARRNRAERARGRRSRHTGLASGLILLGILGAVGLYVYLAAAA
ncbi:hypothetical protein [Streptomyces sp. CC77]|uniref:hypothetical protein n=1 Tax=Streptomyces sp. CC77 TaxID=1906739 RepID=UPI0008DC6217|nr:hypothetical protein [Streptomyces sp. CC77]OII63351.1 hypothetical protein BJP39_10165 [Streptomyces sp. CC77]